ncbi:predicted protein [Histoplasma mississippiense (nom. inval.)]|uniref:predicted protein n=1 Tax=Ajellomyces capsulatus (strain NAm1 / WU24) TaxID=2059318 RepID=UPI000157C219|nr:predicted protein [Histoplasma mississippiense (nom. inval.)]EDN07608.1 predicted protein [Histoplasma mississippiense (nom. inval.)]
MERNTPEKDECSECKKSFARTDNLRVHLKTVCLRNTLRNPAPSTPTGKKRPATVIEHEERRISAGYSHSNASDENQPGGGSHIQTGNNEHLRTHHVLDFTISNPDAPATPGLLPTPTPVQISRARTSLFPDGWVPDEYISPQLKEILEFKAASYGVEEDPEPRETTIMIRQRDAQELPYEILVMEVKKIYNYLRTTEIGCIIEDAKIAHIMKLNERQWANLVECHQTLLHHHYNLLICTQHPIGDGEIFATPVTCKIPSRLLHQGIHVLLEIMKARRPDSHDYMTSFIKYAYGLMTLLIEAVPRFENVWLGCLGDLASYMMCLEKRNSAENMTWKAVSSQWYQKALDKNPGEGSLYHRLGNLSTPNMGGQLFFYSRSLLAPKRYEMSKTRVEFAFRMALDSIQKHGVITPDLPSWFVGSHAMLLRGGSIQKFIVYVKEYIALFGKQVNQWTFKFRETAICMGVPNIAAMLQYGEEDGILTRMFMNPGNHSTNEQPAQADHPQKLSSEAKLQHALHHWMTLPTRPSRNALKHDPPSDDATFSTALQKLTYSTFLNFHTLSFVLNYTRNENIIPYIHLSLAFIWSLALVPDSMVLESTNFPISTEMKFRQLPEDFFFRSQIWSQTLYPPDFFADSAMEGDSRGEEMPSTGSARNERCLWYGYRLASCGRWIQLSRENGVKRFRPTDYATQLEAAAIHPKVHERQDRSQVEDAKILKECTTDDVDVITKVDIRLKVWPLDSAMQGKRREEIEEGKYH